MVDSNFLGSASLTGNYDQDLAPEDMNVLPSADLMRAISFEKTNGVPSPELAEYLRRREEKVEQVSNAE